MRGKIQSPGLPVTNKPNGGYHAPALEVVPEAAARAMHTNDFTEVIRLVNGGRHPDTILTSQGSTPLLCSITQGDTAIAALLLHLGAHPDRAASQPQAKSYIGHVLDRATPGFNQPMLRLLLDHKADPMLPCSESGALPLHFAASKALAGPARALAEHGADPFALDPWGKTAIDYALCLPDFQKALLLFVMAPPPASAQTLQRLASLFPPGDSMLSWMASAWGDQAES